MRGSKSMVIIAAVADRGRGVDDPSYRSQLTFFARARSFGAAVALGEFFDATGRVDEFLLTGEKRMTSSANTDSNVTARRARVIDRDRKSTRLNSSHQIISYAVF